MPGEQQLLYVHARVGNEAIGFPVEVVREIVHVPQISRVPRAPQWLKGMASLRGQVIPVVCLRERLGMDGGRCASQERLIVAEVQRVLVGFLVDCVQIVHRFDERDIEPPTALLLNERNRFVQAIGHLGQELVLLLNPDLLLEPKQLERLQQVTNQAA